MLTLALSDIASLGTQVAMHGSIRASEVAGDEIFEMMVAIVVIVYEG
ncbi:MULTISPECIES: hypothetical protein [unclassified Sphingomonas]|nr:MULTISPECIES: hypothetical protein [unclassified Sphingomonas]MCR5870463.1 hypothetical protein [Sphingomonas sp. J344]UUY01192.1 hypothetical protein LRS08_09240 [Sphingomonas sp. J315]